MLKVRQILIKQFDEKCLRICLTFFKNQEEKIKELISKIDIELFDYYPGFSEFSNKDFNFYVYCNEKESCNILKKALVENDQLMFLMLSRETDSLNAFCELCLKQFDLGKAIY